MSPVPRSLALLAALVTAACATQPAPRPPTDAAALLRNPTSLPTRTPLPRPTPITAIDGLGREVMLAAPAVRIVTLAPSNTEILFAIGAGDLVVGRDEVSDYPPEAAAVPSIGSTYGDLNTEPILALEPDLILAAAITPPEHILALESLGLTVFVVGNPADFRGLFDNLELVGLLTEHADEARGIAASLQSRYEAVVDAMYGLEAVTVFYEVDGSDARAPWTTGSGTFQQLMLDLAGGANIASDLQGWGQLSLEEIVVRDPEVIVFGAGPFIPTTVESLKARPGWRSISAVVNGRVYAIDTDLIDLPGPRLVEGLEQLARFLHPEAFGE